MSDPKHGGMLGPNDPAYYAPRELRERAAGGEPDSVLKQAAEWRPRLTAEDPPPQVPGRPLQRRENSEMFNKAVAQALQESMEPTLVEAPSVLRDMSGRRALFSVALRLLDRGGRCGRHCVGSRHGHPGVAAPRKRHAIDFGDLAVGEIVDASGAATAATQAHRDLVRTGGQRARQRCAAARHSCGRASSGRLRRDQWAAGRGPADIRQACRQRVARARNGNFRGIGYSVRRLRRSGAGDGGIARRRRRGTRRRLDAIVLDGATRRCCAASRPAAGCRAAGRPCRCRAAGRKPGGPAAGCGRAAGCALGCFPVAAGRRRAQPGPEGNPGSRQTRAGIARQRRRPVGKAAVAAWRGSARRPLRAAARHHLRSGSCSSNSVPTGSRTSRRPATGTRRRENGASPPLSGSLKRSRFPADFNRISEILTRRHAELVPAIHVILLGAETGCLGTQAGHDG